MNTAAVIFILLIPGLLLWKESARLTPVVLVSLPLTLVLLGYARLDALNGSHLSFLYCGAELCLLAGYFAHRSVRPVRPAAAWPAPLTTAPRRSASPVVWFFGVVVVLAAYHLIASGVPTFLEDVETARFDFNASGFFGIPGRMFLFGLPFVVFLVNLAAGRAPRRVSRRLVYLVWFSYVIASVLGGFKGALLQAAMVLLLVRGLMGRPVSFPRLAGGLRTLLLMAALLFGGAMAFRYKSLGIATLDDLGRYAWTRATDIPAVPGYFAVGRYGTGGSGGEQFLHDARYFLGRYVPLVGPGPDMLLPLDKTISAAMSGTPVSTESFIVPVTVGAFPELVVNFGAAAGLALMFLVGAVFSWAAARAQASRRLWNSAFFGFAVYLLQIYVLNGNLMYLAFNFVLMSLLLLLTYAICGFLSQVFRPGEYQRGSWALGNGC